MRDPLMPETDRDSSKKKIFFWGVILAVAILAAILAALTAEKRVYTYDVEVPVEIQYSDPESAREPGVN